MRSCSFNFTWLISSLHGLPLKVNKDAHNRVFNKIKQAKKLIQYINKLSTKNFCGYSVDKCVNLYIIPFYVRFTFLGRMQKNSRERPYG